MTNPIQLFTNPTIRNIQDVLYECGPLAPEVWACIKAISRIHWYWQWYLQKEIYQNPDNWLGLLIGHTAQLTINNELIRTAAHLVLITNRIQRFTKEIGRFRKEVKRLANAIDGYDIPIGPHNWWVPQKLTYLSFPVVEVRLHYLYHHWKVRLARIQRHTIEVFKSLFTLTMLTVEVYDAFYRRDTALRESVVNLAGILREIRNHQAGLKHGVNDTSKIVNKIFTKWGITLNAETVLNPLVKGIQFTSQVSAYYDNVSKNVGEDLLMTVDNIVACTKIAG